MSDTARQKGLKLQEGLKVQKGLKLHELMARAIERRERTLKIEQPDPWDSFVPLPLVPEDEPGRIDGRFDLCAQQFERCCADAVAGVEEFEFVVLR